ncbi:MULTISPECIES: DUF4252 domain-containing protein [unclassified Dysgonomonas]|jgi:hypothetical protein|uniref:DUF4252 domain-containing protein n=1 Tax=unclassified Dysgonomonas TaxID=2630389 RepID=UPI0025BC5430|nr:MULTISPECIES: DUF4252 domain-containing protein [unclassified Dysgonomonas]MDR2001521.1 DUF4252 domain-containing protein [Prevotella sp.]HMM03094.1 DUF4252 domain-containing protein [Dysgonomonas sp.]
MKKYLFCLVLLFGFILAAPAQNIDQLLKKVSKTENIEKVKIGKFMMSLGKAFGGVGDMPVARGIHSMEIYDLSSCDNGLKKDLAKQFNKLKDGGGYETLIYAKDKRDGVRIMVKKDKDTIKEMIILCMDEQDPTIIRFSGKIKDNDIAELVNKYDK